MPQRKRAQSRTQPAPEASHMTCTCAGHTKAAGQAGSSCAREPLCCRRLKAVAVGAHAYSVSSAFACATALPQHPLQARVFLRQRSHRRASRANSGQHADSIIIPIPVSFGTAGTCRAADGTCHPTAQRRRGTHLQVGRALLAEQPRSPGGRYS